jgi:diphosphomevalonate decarboxylase
LKATAIAHANIALVKYWGKRQAALNLPAAGSISMTLKELFTRTSVCFQEDLSGDILFLDGRRAEAKPENRVSKFLDIIRQRAGITSFAEISTENNFPTAAGLASSASGFAALAAAASRAAGLSLSPGELSILARLGSGSAARSIFGGFVEMQPGVQEDGSDALAVQLYDENYWPLDMLICITSETKKSIGSTEGMARTAETSPFYSSWIASSRRDIEEMRAALAKKDFQQVGEITEFSCFKMHGLALSARPAILYWNDVTVTLIQEIRALRKTGIPAFITIDAGPQVKILCQPHDRPAIRNHLENIKGIKKIVTTSVGPGVRVLEG